MHGRVVYALLAGAVTGAVAGLAFATAHALIIEPIGMLFVACPIGGAIQGLLIGLVWRRSRHARPALTGLAFGALYAGALLPLGAVAITIDCEDPARESLSPACIPVILVPALLIGAAVGAITRDGGAAGVAGLSGLLLAFPMSAQILISGDTGGVGWDTLFFAVILVILLGAGVVLERVHGRLGARGAGVA